MILAMVFVTFAVLMISAIAVTRNIVNNSKCRMCQMVWSKALLSQYDINLYNDYNILAFHGTEKFKSEQLEKLASYTSSVDKKFVIDQIGVSLSGLELQEPDNFRASLNHQNLSSVASTIKSGRSPRGEAPSNERAIRNSVVIGTLPSHGISSSIDIDELAKSIKSGGLGQKVKDIAKSGAIDLVFANRYLASHISTGERTNTYFANELEYLISGKLSDSENFDSVKNKILLVRNALNIAHIYADSGKRDTLLAIAELIAPEGAILVQAALAEAWALAESKHDLSELLEGRRIPFIKTKENWYTDLDSILDSFAKEQLEEEARKAWQDNQDEVKGLAESQRGHSIDNSKGESYDDYLYGFLLVMNPDVRLLRIMDIVSINMKFNHYQDFNMMEYSIGLSSEILINGKKISMHDQYQ